MVEFNLRASGGTLLIGSLENPNRMPFEGILTYLGVPSDLAPHGSGGRKVLIPVEVGSQAVDSLKGMPVNLSASMDEHDTSAIVGIIEDAWVGESGPNGTPIHVKGHIFAKYFPNEAHAIKASQQALGFSYETAKTKLEDGVYNGEPVAIVKSLVFTGASILYKKAAAYQSTSLAASADEESELEAKKLSPEERRDFALPSKKMFPMPDAEHVRLAWDMVSRAKGLTDEERAEARRNILKRAHELGIDTSNWDTGNLKASDDRGVEIVDDVTKVTDGVVEAGAEDNNTAEKVDDANVEAKGESKQADQADTKDEDLDKKDVELDSQLVKLLPQVLEELKALREELKSFKEKDVKASAENEPQRRSADSTQLMTKYDKEETDVLASIESQKYTRPEDSMAAKLAFFFGNNK